MAVLVIADHDNAALNDATNKTVTAAKKFGGDVDVLVAGEGAGDVASAAAGIDGVRKVLHADGTPYKKQLAEAMEALVLSVADGYDAIFAPATTMGKNVLPRIAAKLDVMQLSDITDIIDQDTFERPIYAGNAIMTVKTSDAKKVATVRGTAFDAAGEGGSAAIETLDAPAGPFKAEFISEEIVKSDRPELTAAKASGFWWPRTGLRRRLQQVHHSAG